MTLMVIIMQLYTRCKIKNVFMFLLFSYDNNIISVISYHRHIRRGIIINFLRIISQLLKIEIYNIDKVYYFCFWQDHERILVKFINCSRVPTLPGQT